MKKQISLLLLIIFSNIILAQTERPLNTRTFRPTPGADDAGYIKHSNEDAAETYYTSTTFSSYTGGLWIKKFKADGLVKWTGYVDYSEIKDLSLSKKYMAVDHLDNVTVISSPTETAMTTGFRKYKDPEDIVEILSGNKPYVIKLDKDGKLIFKKSLDFLNKNNFTKSVYCDNAGDIYVLGVDEQGVYPALINTFFILKLNGTTGAQIFKKSYEHIRVNSATLTFDAQDNYYVLFDGFLESDGNYNFDGIPIERSMSGDNILLKYTKNGAVILGKNFHHNIPNNTAYSIITDATFDGENLALVGYLTSGAQRDYRGLDDELIPWKYTQTARQGLVAKINTNGNVIWQKPIYSSTNLDLGMCTNIQTDVNKDIYGYFFFRGNVTYDNVEYQFDLLDGEKVVSKYSSAGNVLYFDSVDKKVGYPQYQSSMMIDLISKDIYNVSAITQEDNFLNYPTNSILVTRNYIATFGNLSTKYLTPQNNFLELTAAAISNNPAPTPNEFSFDLINNVNWTATSDQSWLSLSSISLTSKSPQKTITGNGDAKITLTADENTTGAMRSSNVEISGEGVPSKTLIVSQTATLGVNSSTLSLTTLYPNPTSDILNIETQQKISKIEIFDLSGKLVKSVEGKAKNISVSNLTNGMYLIKLYTESGVMNSKFIKK